MSGQQRLLSAGWSVAVYAGFAAAVLVLCPLVGAERLDVGAIVEDLRRGQTAAIDTDIFVYQRVPRVLLAFVTGAVLAAAGNTFQVILRNPLATPYTLGVTGGAAVGAYAAIAFPALQVSVGGYGTVQLTAMAGAGLIVVLLYAASRGKAGLSMTTMLLAGVTISIMCGALIILIRYLTKPDLLVALDRWTMGRLDTVGYESVTSILPAAGAGLLLIGLQGRSLNHLALGEEMAWGQGVDVAVVQKYCFIGGSVATAAVVSAAGPIGFIGLIVPHMVRRLSGFDNRMVMAGCVGVGGGFLVLCDTLARTVVAPTEVPVGVLTALIGGPCFIYLLLKRR